MYNWQNSIICGYQSFRPMAHSSLIVTSLPKREHSISLDQSDGRCTWRVIFTNSWVMCRNKNVCLLACIFHDRQMESKHIPRYTSFVRVIHRSPELWNFLWSAPKQTIEQKSRRRWFEPPSRSSCRHCNVTKENTYGRVSRDRMTAILVWKKNQPIKPPNETVFMWNKEDFTI